MAAFVGVRYYLAASASQKSLQVLANNIATRVASAVQPTIWNIYSKSVDRKYSEDITSALLDAEFLDPHVIGISVYGNFGHVYMARYKIDGEEVTEHSAAIHDQAVKLASNRSLISVRQGAMTIGNVLVLLSDTPNQQLMRKILLVELGQLLIISLFFILFLFYAIKKALVEPVGELEEANIELEEFSYRVSHDLRSPIISSLTLLRMIEKVVAKDQANKLMPQILLVISSLEQLERLLNDIYSILVIRSKEEAEEEVDVNAMIDESIKLLSHLEGASEIKIIKDIDDNNIIKTKPTRLRMIIENLVSNAIKYRDPNKEQSIIKFRTRHIENAYTLEIEDNGLGIPEEARPDIFEMFKRFHPKASFGSGLGLYLVKKSALRINAEIEYEAIEDGTKFKLTI